MSRASDYLKGGSSQVTSMEWWADDLEDHDVSGRIGAVVRHIRQRTFWRRDMDLLHAGMYGGGAATAALNNDSRVSYSYEPMQMPRNVCKQAVDTVQAKVAKHRPLPQVLTDRGNWKQQKRARKLTQYLEGVFHQTKFFEKHWPTLVRDAAVFGRGVVRPYRCGKKVKVERVHPWELLVDDWDARYGEPRSIYHARTMDAGVAIAQFADDDETIASDIMSAAGTSPADEFDWQTAIDSSVMRVRIVEAWHLCDDEEAHDEGKKHHCTGRHVISVMGGRVLVNEEWDGKRFPFVILNYCEPVAGFWGSGLAEVLEGWQLAINEQFQKVQDAHHMLGGGIIFKSETSDIVDEHLTNGNVNVITHRAGEPPTFTATQPGHPAVYARERDMPQDALGEVGLTVTSAQGQKQPGINSGVAINAMDDIEDERHIVFGRKGELACLEVAEHFIELEAEIAKQFGELSVSVPMSGGLLPLKWKDVTLDDFQIRVFPTSMLPQQLGARLEYLNFLFDRQLIDRQTFIQQLGGPDAAAEMDLETADRLNVDEKLEAILDAEADHELLVAQIQATPSAYQDLKWAQKRAQQRYNQAQSRGCPEMNLQALRDYMDECQAEIDKLAAKAGGVPQGMPGMPPGPPGMGPVPPPVPLPQGSTPMPPQGTMPIGNA